SDVGGLVAEGDAHAPTEGREGVERSGDHGRFAGGRRPGQHLLGLRHAAGPARGEHNADGGSHDAAASWAIASAGPVTTGPPDSRRTSTSCAAMEMAISSTVIAPMPRPMGAKTFASSWSGTPR